MSPGGQSDRPGISIRSGAQRLAIPGHDRPVGLENHRGQEIRLQTVGLPHSPARRAAPKTLQAETADGEDSWPSDVRGRFSYTLSGSSPPAGRRQSSSKAALPRSEDPSGRARCALPPRSRPRVSYVQRGHPAAPRPEDPAAPYRGPGGSGAGSEPGDAAGPGARPDAPVIGRRSVHRPCFRRAHSPREKTSHASAGGAEPRDTPS